MPRKIALGVVAALVLFFLFAALRPGNFRVERSVTVQAAPQTVFAQVNSLAKFRVWNPWLNHDPEIMIAYDGPEQGVGATLQWQGDKETGAGKMTIQEATPAMVRIREEYVRPFATDSTMEFAFKTAGNAVEVVWSIQGKLPFVPKLMSVFVSMERMIGTELEKGLAKLKTIAEAQPK